MKKIIFYIVFFASALWYCAAGAATIQVVMSNYKFDPQQVTIHVGDTVKWVNKDGTHTTTSGSSCKADGAWDSGNLNPGQSFSFTFTKAGTYPYFCIPHCLMSMTGTVVVR